jgi:hypothetical protein
MDRIPVRFEQPSDRFDPARETGEIAIEGVQLGEQYDEAQIEGARQQAFARFERRGKVDRLAVEAEKRRGHLPFGRGEVIQERGIAGEVEIRPAGIVGGDRRERGGWFDHGSERTPLEDLTAEAPSIAMRRLPVERVRWIGNFVKCPEIPPNLPTERNVVGRNDGKRSRGSRLERVK